MGIAVQPLPYPSPTLPLPAGSKRKTTPCHAHFAVRSVARALFAACGTSLSHPRPSPGRPAPLTRRPRRYMRLNMQAMRLVKPGGLLMTCSCSGAMTQDGSFLRTVMDAARQVRGAGA